MKLYLKVFLLLLFAVGNYYGFKYSAMGLNYPHDAAFLGGLGGLLTLLVTDFLIIRRVVLNFIKKETPQTNETK
jgi:hypothetical protein